MSEVGTNLDGPDWWNRRLVLMIRKISDPFATNALHTMLNVVRTKDKLFSLHTLECVTEPHTVVSRHSNAPMVGNHSCVALLLRNRMISPTFLSRGVR